MHKSCEHKCVSLSVLGERRNVLFALAYKYSSKDKKSQSVWFSSSKFNHFSSFEKVIRSGIATVMTL